MRQYLQLFWILGSLVACSGNSNAGDGNANEPDSTSTAGSTVQVGSGAGTGGSQSGVGGAGNGAGAASGGGSAAGSEATAGGSRSTAGAGSGGASVAGGGGAGMAGASTAGAGGGPPKKQPPELKFPTANGADQKLSATKVVSDFDGKGVRYVGTGPLGSGGQNEGQDPLFFVKAGGSLKNVILGSPAADGVHCEGSCTIDNVWWEDVGEDAITLLGSSSSNVYRISNSGARNASDKVIQHNGGGTLYVKNFLVETYGKLYRSCGNCSDQYARHVEFDTIVANGNKGELAGVNANYKDSAKFVNIFADLTTKICERYTGNNTGAEPPSVGTGADGTYCVYTAADITWH